MKLGNVVYAMAIILLALGILGASPLAAQGLFGTISGAVTDPTGAIIPGATVSVTNVATNVKMILTTNSAGEYSVSSLNPGIYRVEASAKGFKNAVQNDIVL